MTKSTDIKPRLMRIQPDFLKYSGIKSATSVYNMALRGDLLLIKQGRFTYVDLESYEEMLARNVFMPDREMPLRKDRDLEVRGDSAT